MSSKGIVLQKELGLLLQSCLIFLFFECDMLKIQCIRDVTHIAVINLLLYHVARKLKYRRV